MRNVLTLNSILGVLEMFMNGILSLPPVDIIGLVFGQSPPLIECNRSSTLQKLGV